MEALCTEVEQPQGKAKNHILLHSQPPVGGDGRAGGVGVIMWVACVDVMMWAGLNVMRWARLCGRHDVERLCGRLTWARLCGRHGEHVWTL